MRDCIGPWRPGAALPPLHTFRPDTNFVVCAAAGSGKTTALVGRMVSLIRTGAPVGDLVAITFTKKAAAEMQGRFYEELHAARVAATDPTEARRLGRALQDLAQCFIGTIHAFCARLLRGRSERIGIPRDFTPGLEDREKRELREQFWQRYLQTVWDERPERMEELLGAGVNLGELEGFFGDLVRVPELEVYTDGPEAPPRLDGALREAEAFLGEWGGFIPASRPEKGPDKAMTALQDGQAMLRYLDMDEQVHQVKLLKTLAGAVRSGGKKGRVTLNRWPDKDRAKTLRDNALPEFVSETVQPALRRWKSYVHRLIAAFAHEAVDAFRMARWGQGQLTFHDLLLAARDLLRDHPDARAALGAQYPRLLVDEFQDTDPVQAEVLFYLTHEGESSKGESSKKDASKKDASKGDASQENASHEADPSHEETTHRGHAAPDRWDACTPGPGRLFIVGDDKQSIYGFREADIDLFDTVRRKIDDQPHGEAVTLQTNFRSLSGICDWCDGAFSELFDADGRLARSATSKGAQAGEGQAGEGQAGEGQAGEGQVVQADYVSFEARHPTPAGWAPVRELVVPYVKGASTSRKIARRNAKQIAGLIRRACEEGGAPLGGQDDALQGVPGDFMILTRDTTRLSIFAEALAEANVPYTLAGGKDASQSEELRGLVDLLASVYRPDDPVARVAYLRGPLVGLSDEELYRFKKAGGELGESYELRPAVMNALEGGLAARLEAAYGHLQTAEALLKERRPAAAIETLAEQLGLVPRALQDAAQGSLKAGRLLRVLEEARHLDGQGAHWGEILEELERLLNGELTLDGMTLETGQKGKSKKNGESEQKGEGPALGGVQLLNAHKAKGLEANVVFLADPYSSSYPRDPERYVRRRAGEVVQPVFVDKGPYHTEMKYGPAAWKTRFKDAAKRAQRAEEHRLQYVAATRAKRLLVVSRYEKKDDAGYWADLYDYLGAEDIPTLEISASEISAPGVPASGVPVSGVPTSDLPAPDLEGRRACREALWEAASTPAYALETVTSGPGEAEVWSSEEGYGRSFGSAVHAALEILHRHEMLRRQSPELNIDRDWLVPILQAHIDALTEQKTQRAHEMLMGWTRGALYAELTAADRVLAEVPVAAFDPQGDEKPESERQLVRGVIDLAFRAAEGWTLVDFKTDQIASADADEAGKDRLDALTERYAPQVRAYASYWSRHAGEDIHRAGLWFTDANRWASVALER